MVSYHHLKSQMFEAIRVGEPGEFSMRMPMRPPDDGPALKQLFSDVSLAQKAFASPMLHGGPYLHWDDLRRRPPPEGLTHEQWWAAVKMQRRGARVHTPFLDKNGQPFWFCELPSIRATLRNVDLHWGGAIGSTMTGTPTPGEGRTYLVRSLAEEPFSSSFLEGAATTREIAKELIFRARAPKTRDERMVLNNYRALIHVKQTQTAPLSPQLICELHRIVTQGTLDRPEMAGVMRGPTDPVHVTDGPTDEILHTPPAAAELTGRLQLICDFANAPDDTANFIHPALKAVIVHFMIGYDHPFIDGNGRTARALFYWMMLKAGYWLSEYVSISSVIKDAPIQYGRAYLETETDEGDLTYFLLNQCKAIAESEKRLHAYVDRKRKEVENLAAVIEKSRREGGYNHRQTALLNDFIRRRLSSVNISSHQKSHSVSYHTSRNDLEELTRRGLLTKRRLGRDTMYTAAAGLDRKLLGASVS